MASGFCGAEVHDVGLGEFGVVQLEGIAECLPVGEPVPGGVIVGEVGTTSVVVEVQTAGPWEDRGVPGVFVPARTASR